MLSKEGERETKRERFKRKEKRNANAELFDFLHN